MNLNQPLTESNRADAGQQTEELLGRVAVEFFEQRAGGKMPSVEDFARKYPQIAEHIRRTFPALELVGESTSHSVDLGIPLGAANERLGDFRIVGELGRGGMGVVYEAEQLSIGRRVALKVLPFATLADPRALARFKNEVRAAATLDHPHIVTVHAVGEERGIHYFAMQLIRGQSLAEVIRDLRQMREERKPAGASLEDSGTSRSNRSDAALRETRTMANVPTSVPSETSEHFYRRVAELGEQAASALHVAHEQGVIHRDIKPANLMLDTTGKVYVTDFGLARIESDAGVTMTGDLIGTLRYMAPEQALAKRITVDHRADVYALGATLYEFATLRPIFDGVNREQLLRQVAFEQPTAPSKVARDIPRDLETIIRKSLSKDPEDRYDTAADLALDLRRWLSDKPILGKRPNSLQMARRWIRRNPTLVIGSLLGLLVLAGALLMGIARANANAEHQRKLAYGPTLNTGYYEYAEGRFETVDRILTTTKPGTGQTDLRSFEWHLLNKLRKDLRTDNRLTFNERIHGIRRSPGGRWLAVLTVSGQLTVVDLQNNYRQTTLKTEPLGSDWMRNLGSSLFAFSPDDRYLYSAAHGKEGHNNSPLLRFDLDSSIPVGTDLSGGTSQPDCYAVSVGPDGCIATLGWSADGEKGDDGEAERNWTCVTRDPDTGDVLAMANAGGMSLAYSPDGSTIAIAGGWDWTIHVLDGSDLNKRHQISVDGADKGSRIVSFSPDSRLLAGNSKMGVKIWDVSNDDETKPVTELQLGNGWAWDLRFLKRDLIATCTEDGGVDVWQLPAQRKVDHVKLRMPARAIEFLEGTDELLIGGAPALLFKSLRRTPTGRVKSSYMHAVGICNGTAALVTNGNELILWQPGKMGPAGIANVWEDLPPKQDRPASFMVTDVSIAPNGQTIAVACEGMGEWQGRDTISVWDRGGTFVTQIEESGRAKFTPDGKYLVVSAGQSILSLWDWRAGKRISTSSAVDVPSGSMAMEFSPTGSWLATGHGGPPTPGAVCVWKVEGDAIRLINRFDRRSGVEDLSFTRDEQWVVACDATGVELHHVTTGATRPLNTTGSVRGVDVTPDGKRIVTADGSMIRFWDVETGERMGSFDAGGFLTAVRFLDDDRLLYIVRGVGASVLDATPG